MRGGRGTGRMGAWVPLCAARGRDRLVTSDL